MTAQIKVCKILFIGSPSTGKTSIIKRYVKNSFAPSYRATIGADFSAKVVKWNEDLTLRLQVTQSMKLNSQRAKGSYDETVRALYLTPP